MELGKLTEENFDNFALKAYVNYRCLSREEFLDDLSHIRYLRSLMRKYRKDGLVDPNRIRLILNHIIILHNVFRPDLVIRMMFFQCEPSLYGILKTYLIFLNLMPKIIVEINGENILSERINIDEALLEGIKKVVGK